MHFTVSRFAGACAAAAICLLTSAAASLAQEAATDAMFVTVPNPITSDAVARIRAVTERRVDTVVFDFNPDGKAASTASFGACLELTDLITGLNNKGRSTIAF